jgi:formylglycine-generating enzyme required for sulfatase activity
MALARRRFAVRQAMGACTRVNGPASAKQRLLSAVWRHARMSACPMAVMILVACTATDPPTVRIESVPENGAELSINGEPVGLTPQVVNNLRPGQQYFAVLEMYGYERETRAFIAPDSGLLDLSIELTPLVGYLTVDTNPSGARVFLNDDTFIGETPIARHTVGIGTHTLTFQRDNYKPHTAEVFVERDRRYVQVYNLQAQDGFIEVYSRPSFSRIYINDHPRPESTPARITLSPGFYTVGIAQDGYITKEFQIELGPNEEKLLEADLTPGDAPPGMVLIPAGEFIFGVQDGAPDEAPRRKIHLDGFYIDRYEVTNKEFKQVFPNHTFEAALADAPVVGVSWRQASEYARAVGKRLPTEKEWEKAARGPDGLNYPWGNVFLPENVNMAHPGSTRNAGPVKVGSYRAGASPYGVMDMAGNAYEWTQDWYGPYDGNTTISTEYGQVFRVLRGGSFLSNDPFQVRGSRRHYDRPEATRADYGFRCAKDVAR